MWEKTPESPLDSKEIKPVISKGNQSWIFIGKTDAEAETPILWPPHAKSWLIGKDSDAGRDCRQEEKGMTEDEMAEWHHQLNGNEFEQRQEIVKDRVARVRQDWTTKQQEHTLLIIKIYLLLIGYPLQYSWASLVAQMVKNLPAMWETWVWSLGWGDPLEKEMAAHSSILAWKIPWITEPGRLPPVVFLIFNNIKIISRHTGLPLL